MHHTMFYWLGFHHGQAATSPLRHAKLPDNRVFANGRLRQSVGTIKAILSFATDRALRRAAHHELRRGIRTAIEYSRRCS